MISLIRKIAQLKLAKTVRSLIGIRPIIVDVRDVNENISISDGFLWRTDNNFKTTFRFSDILKIFYKMKNKLKNMGLLLIKI